MKQIFLVAGEVSADHHGAALISELRSITEVNVFGLGGDALQSEGMELTVHLETMAFLGLSEVLRHLPYIKQVRDRLLEQVDREKPDLAILIDYPGFNLRLAKQLWQKKVPVVYYISPQLWAWGKRRVHKIRKYVDKMLVLFPFEKTFYEQHGIRAEYVGHPLVDHHFEHLPKNRKAFEPGKAVLGLLPGSRKQEVASLLPRMLQTARQLHAQGQIERVQILKAAHLPENMYRGQMTEADSFIELKEETIHRFLPQQDVTLVASGTATLEVGYFGVPMVIVYQVQALTYWLAKNLVKIKNIGLVNIVAETEVAKELIQQDFTVEAAVREITTLLDPQTHEQVQKKLELIREKLGEPGASRRAAQAIVDFMETLHAN